MAQYEEELGNNRHCPKWSDFPWEVLQQKVNSFLGIHTEAPEAGHKDRSPIEGKSAGKTELY